MSGFWHEGGLRVDKLSLTDRPAIPYADGLPNQKATSLVHHRYPKNTICPCSCSSLNEFGSWIVGLMCGEERRGFRVLP